ncbi:MAG: hypothetical protein M1830_009054 [Pleopsidium flavum]|nr:MAG: hypothetical protein M1830_009054 [Pleopsidium flavum]
MPREAEPSLNERSFVLQALRENVRIDGRALDAFRDMELFFGNEYGIADVRLGKTRVIARISASITTPFPDRKFDGIFTITTELSPMASPSFEPGRPHPTEPLLTSHLEKALRRSSALDTESLCLLAGQKCWSIRADVHILSHDGGLLDASCIAVIAALQHFRRPDVTVAGEEVRVYSPRERVPVGLTLLHWPLCVTFSFFAARASAGEGGEMVMVVVVDAALQEEQIREGEVIVTMNRHGEVCQIAKLGGVTVDALTLLNCTNVALVKVQEITKFITRRLEEDAKARDRGGLMAELSAENER